MLKAIPKSLSKRILGKFGLELKRIDESIPLATFFESPKEALLFSQGGKTAGFSCPISQCTHYTGIGFSSSDWNPFIETLKQFEENPLLKYDDSILKKFYMQWNPKNAAEMTIGFQNPPKAFKSYPPHYIFLSPWSSLSPSEVDIDGRLWNKKDNDEHGCRHLRFPNDGWTFSGPVHPDKGNLEFNRFINLYKSIKSQGYDKSKGLIGVTQLKRKSEYRYLIGGGGYHRAIVLAALGHEFIPARFHRNSSVNVDDVGIWPQIQSGIWTPVQALDYVNHLFTVSSQNWAKGIGLSENEL